MAVKCDMDDQDGVIIDRLEPLLGHGRPVPRPRNLKSRTKARRGAYWRLRPSAKFKARVRQMPCGLARLSTSTRRSLRNCSRRWADSGASATLACVLENSVQYAWGPGGARGGEQPAERGGTHVADELVDLGGQAQLAIAGEPVEELWHEGMEAMRADVSGGLPQDLRRRGHGGAVEARAAGARAGRGRPRRPPEQSGRPLSGPTRDGGDPVPHGPLLRFRCGPPP